MGLVVLLFQVRVSPSYLPSSISCTPYSALFMVPVSLSPWDFRVTTLFCSPVGTFTTKSHAPSMAAAVLAVMLSSVDSCYEKFSLHRIPELLYTPGQCESIAATAKFPR